MAKQRIITLQCTVEDGLFQATAHPPPSIDKFPPLDLGMVGFTYNVLGTFTFRGYINWTGQGGVGANINYKWNLDLQTSSGHFSGYGGHSESSPIVLVAPAMGDPSNSVSLDLAGGTITVTMEVEEEETTLTDPDFPATFGVKAEHGPLKTTAHFRERVRLGLNKITIDANVGGASLHREIEITSVNRFYLDDPAFGYGSVQSATAEALPTASSVALNCQVLFDGVPIILSCPLSGSDHGHVVGGSSVSSTAPQGTRLGPGFGRAHRTTATTNIWPEREWALYTYFRSLGNPYPGSVNLRVDKHKHDLNALVICPVDGSQAATYAQRRFSYNGQFSDKEESSPWTFDTTASWTPGYTGIQWIPTGTQPTSADVDEWQDFQCGLDNAYLIAQSEEVEDWRCLIQSKLPFSAGTVTHNESFGVEDGTNPWSIISHIISLTNAGGYVVAQVDGTGPGVIERTLNFPTHEQNPKMDWQAGVIAEVVLQCDAASQPFTFEADGKTWSDTTGGANIDVTRTFELRIPENASSETDATQSRWPVGTEGPYRGPHAILKIRLSGLAAGRTYKLKSITLKRKSLSRLHFGMPLAPWLFNGVGSDYLRHVLAEGYKELLEVAGMTRTPKLPSGFDYGHPPIQDFFNTIDIRPGWAKTILATGDQLLIPLMWIGGLYGACWNGSGWQTSLDLDATAGVSLPVAVAADVIRWYPHMGEPQGAYGQVTPMRVAKVFHTRCLAQTVDTVTDSVVSGEDVTFGGGPTPPETVATDVEGYARSSARKSGEGTISVGALSVPVTLRNRWIPWAGFAVVGEAGDQVVLLMQRVGGHAAVVKNESGDIFVARSVDLVRTFGGQQLAAEGGGNFSYDAILDSADRLLVACQTGESGPVVPFWSTILLGSNFNPTMLSAIADATTPVWLKTPEGIVYLFAGGASYQWNPTTLLLQADTVLTGLAALPGFWTWGWVGDRLWIARDESGVATLRSTVDRGRSFTAPTTPAPLSGVDARCPRLVTGPDGDAALLYWDAASGDLKALYSRDGLTTWAAAGTAVASIPEQCVGAVMWRQKVAVAYIDAEGNLARRECRALSGVTPGVFVWD